MTTDPKSEAVRAAYAVARADAKFQPDFADELNESRDGEFVNVGGRQFREIIFIVTGAF